MLNHNEINLATFNINKACSRQLFPELINLFICLSLSLTLGFNKEDTRTQEEIVREKLLQVLESAYPNILAIEDIIR